MVTITLTEEEWDKIKNSLSRKNVFRVNVKEVQTKAWGLGYDAGYTQGYYDGKEDYIQGTWNRSMESPQEE